MGRFFGLVRAHSGWSQALLAAAACCGCSDGEGDAVDVSGAWCGKQVATAAECVGDEVEYLELNQAANVVTGKVCEAYDNDCNDIQSGTVAEERLDFFYTFSGFRVDATLDILDASTMRGSFTSNKCACSIALTMHRLN
jgi:hypothetical protein